MSTEETKRIFSQTIKNFFFDIFCIIFQLSTKLDEPAPNITVKVNERKSVFIWIFVADFLDTNGYLNQEVPCGGYCC